MKFVSFKSRGERGVVEGLLGAGGEVLEFDLRPFLADHDRMGGAEVFGFLELLADFCRLEREVSGEAKFAASLDDLEGFRAAGFVGDDDKHIARLREGGLEFFGGGGGFVDEVAEDDIAHAEADGRQVGGSVAEALHKAVVASTSSEGAEVFRAVENLEDHAGVVGQAADDGGVEGDLVGDPVGLEERVEPAQIRERERVLSSC